MVAKIERERKHHRKAVIRLIDLRLCLLAATLTLSGLSVLHSLSSTQIRLTSEQDYRRLSFIAMVRPQTEETEHRPPACEHHFSCMFEWSHKYAEVKYMHGYTSMHIAAAHKGALPSAVTVYADFRPGALWLDTDGVPIQVIVN